MGLRKRQEAAFESLYSRHVREVYGYALGMLGSSADAEDVTQTTFLNAYRALEGGKRPRTPRSWLFAIAHNVCRQRFRQAARRPREVELHDAYAVEEETDAPSASDIARALQSLPFTQRSALVMRELEGRSQVEIADALGVSVSAVETLLFRARRGMREQLESSMTCGEAARAISRQLDGASSRAERSALRAHLRVCEECATFARRARARSGAMRRVGGALPLPASLLSWSLGGGGGAGAAAAPAAAGLGMKLLAGAAAVAVCAGATEQVVVHRDPPAPRVAAVHAARPGPARPAPPAKTMQVEAIAPARTPVTKPGESESRGHAKHGGRATGGSSGRHGHGVAGGKSRHADGAGSRRAGSWRGATSHRSGSSRGTSRRSLGRAAMPRSTGSQRSAASPRSAATSRSAASSRSATSPSSAASTRSTTTSRSATSRRSAATSRSAASPRHATTPRGANDSAPRGYKR